MQNDEKLKNERNMLFIDSLADFLASTESKSSEEVREELIVEGIDPDISTNRLIEYAHKCSMDANRQLISMYGPFRCYSAWEAWAWVRDAMTRLPGLVSVYGFLLLAALFCLFLWVTR